MTPSLFRLKSWLRAGASLACVAWVASSQFATAATPQPQYTGDLIIKWRDDTSGTRKTLSASEASNRLLSVAQAAGSTLQVKRTLATNAQLMRTGLTDAASIQATVDKIAQDARVAYVVPDRILRPNTVPNDPLFATQNNLAAPALVPGGINAAAAWSITQGSTGIVVAVVDTGYTDHPDLTPKILPGYYFCSVRARAGNYFVRGTDALGLRVIV
jgi:serine protease